MLHDVLLFLSFFFFNDTATTEIYTLSLHDALPIWSFKRRKGCNRRVIRVFIVAASPLIRAGLQSMLADSRVRSEEHTSELQSRSDLVCRLLLEKKKKCTISFKLSLKRFYLLAMREI